MNSHSVEMLLWYAIIIIIIMDSRVALLNAKIPKKYTREVRT